MSTLKPHGDVRTPKLGLVKLYSKVVFGASGAISSQTASGSSGFTVSLSATGLYDILTVDTWADLVMVHGIIYNAGTARDQGVEVSVKYGASTAKTLTINITSTDAAEEPIDGDELWLELTFNNTSVGP